MARLTAQERQMLADLSKRAKDEDDEDAGTELWVETESGHRVKLTGAKAARFMRKHRLDEDDEDASDEEADDEETPDEKPKREGYFVGKKKAS